MDDLIESLKDVMTGEGAGDPLPALSDDQRKIFNHYSQTMRGALLVCAETLAENGVALPAAMRLASALGLDATAKFAALSLAIQDRQPRRATFAHACVIALDDACDFYRQLKTQGGDYASHDDEA